MEAYPIIIDGELAGKLTVDRQGALTAFHAECSSLPGLVRLSVYGGGREGYLGVLAPEGEKLTLHKALSRAAMREFPPEIESVERAGLDRAASPKGEETPEPAAETGSAHGGAPEEPEAARQLFQHYALLKDLRNCLAHTLYLATEADLTADCGAAPGELLREIEQTILACYPACDPAVFSVYGKCIDYIKGRL